MTDLPVSKTRRKKEMHALQDLGEVLVGLSASQVAGLDLPERLSDAIDQARRISGFEARRRQMQYIGRLMRDIDAAPIAARVQQLQTEHQRVNARQHEIERWRDRLLDNEVALTELARSYSGVDTQRLRTLLRNARKEQAQGRPPHATRALFRALRDILSVGVPPDAPPPAADE